MSVQCDPIDTGGQSVPFYFQFRTHERTRTVQQFPDPTIRFRVARAGLVAGCSRNWAYEILRGWQTRPPTTMETPRPKAYSEFERIQSEWGIQLRLPYSAAAPL